MKVPPAALTAPSLCPRCDAAALYEDRCSSCSLQLAKCGACQGVAGPFDRYCGFCGHDLAVGEARSPVWRFWLLVAMIPMVAALVIGATFFGGPAASQVGRLVFRNQPEPSPTVSRSGTRTLRSVNLHLLYAMPTDWSSFDYTLSAAAPMKEVVVSRIGADGSKFGDSKGDLLSLKPSGVLMTLGAPGTAPPGVDTTDPSSVLGAEISSLTIKPPPGLKIDVSRQATSIMVDGRIGKEVVLQVTRADGTVFFFERVYLFGPSGLFRVDALVPQFDWQSGDDQKVEAVIRSVQLTT